MLPWLCYKQMCNNDESCVKQTHLRTNITVSLPVSGLPLGRATCPSGTDCVPVYSHLSPAAALTSEA